MDGYENGIQYLIINERRTNRRNANGDPGVRVQTSGTSDPTASAAIDNVMLSQAFASGDLDKELEDTDNADQYRIEARLIRDMREDYALATAQIQTLSLSEKKLLVPYLQGEKKIIEIATENNVEYSSVKTCICRARGHLKERVTVFLETKYAFIKEKQG